MTPTLWISLILGAGGLCGAIIAAVTKLRDWRRDKEKKEGEIQLDDASYTEIAARAAKINSDERIETERWWKEQFDAVKLELAEEKAGRVAETRWRRKAIKRMQLHQPWDHQQYENCPQHGPPPPLWDENDEEDLNL